MRGQKGITLVALIITIVVLLILAVVAIATISNTGIIDKANETGTKYNESVDNEAENLQVYENTLDNYLN